MIVFITGATGYIGQKLALHLADEGHVIHALVRDIKKAESLLLHPNMRLFHGDILNVDSIKAALSGCGQVYHLAALASVWSRDRNSFWRMNVQGLKNVLDCCVSEQIQNVLFTSTAGVVGHSLDGEPVAEQTNLRPALQTDYEKTKLQAEMIVNQYCKLGLRIVIVNPSRVYGPGVLTESNGFTRLLKMYLNGNWKVKPGRGDRIGNYVYIDDVVKGIIAAMARAKPGERYLMGGTNISYKNFFKMVDQITGKKRKLLNFPVPMILFISYIQLYLAKLSGRQPLITPPFVRKYNRDWIVSSAKAQKEFGYTITPLEVGLKKTIDWLGGEENY